MEVIKLKMGGSKKNNGLFIRVTSGEALLLIESLAAQLVRNDPNGQRQEFFADDGTYVTIAAHNTSYAGYTEKEKNNEKKIT